MSDDSVFRTRRTLMLATLAGAASPALAFSPTDARMATSAWPRKPETWGAGAIATPSGRLVLSGRVVNSAGEPVRGARIELAHEQAQVFTDADGRFLWTGRMPGKGMLQCRVGGKAGESCQMSADLWTAHHGDGPFELHASQDHEGLWRASLSEQPAA